MAGLRTPTIIMSLLLIIGTGTVVTGEYPGDPTASGTAEFKAVRFSNSEAGATRELNELAKAGWSYVGPLGNGLVAFRRDAVLHVDAARLQGEWEFLSYEEDGVVKEYKPGQRLTLTIAGENWTVGENLVKHRVDISGRDLVFHGLADGLPFTNDETPQTTLAFGIFELKGDSLIYCTTTASASASFSAGHSPVKKPTSFETHGTGNLVYRLRRK